MNPELRGPPTEAFIQAFTRHQRPLYLFILTQVPRTVDAEEILQETNVVIWSKYQDFREGTNFFAWAARIATYEVLKFRQRGSQDKLQFTRELVDVVAQEALARSDEWELRRTALEECLQRLKPEDQTLIQQRYRPGANGQTVAEQLGRPANSVYQSLARIRKSLLDCIRRRLAAETSTASGT